MTTDQVTALMTSLDEMNKSVVIIQIGVSFALVALFASLIFAWRR